MGEIITESEVDFGEFEAENLFAIESSDILKKLGQGIKTVEFVTLFRKDNIIFLEAKTGCPNPNNKEKGGEDAERFQLFYDDIADKYIDSLQVYLAGVLEKFEDTGEIGKNLVNVKSIKNKKIKFVLVITADEILEDWLQGPKLELEARLKRFIKIWGIKVVVLNKQLAMEYGIVCGC